MSTSHVVSCPGLLVCRVMSSSVVYSVLPCPALLSPFNAASFYVICQATARHMSVIKNDDVCEEVSVVKRVSYIDY